ncbi:C-type lectin domain family 4 member E-like isoform X2 [Mytilus trossulus]|uniref:C-type lectin domain family 4 member E-like isoform X2 n=1 Tax=Mytilus trossulus TaxID=6551 RepID=UPI003006D5F8
MVGTITVHPVITSAKTSISAGLKLLLSDCKALSANLAVVDDRDTLNFLFSKINPSHQKPQNGVCQTNADYWIDGTDQVVEGHWIWATFSNPIEGNFWCPGNPSNSGGHEDCLEFKDGHWNDDVCTNRQPFICEMEYPVGGQAIIG